MVTTVMAGRLRGRRRSGLKFDVRDPRADPLTETATGGAGGAGRCRRCRRHRWLRPEPDRGRRAPPATKATKAPPGRIWSSDITGIAFGDAFSLTVGEGGDGTPGGAGRPRYDRSRWRRAAGDRHCCRRRHRPVPHRGRHAHRRPRGRGSPRRCRPPSRSAPRWRSPPATALRCSPGPSPRCSYPAGISGSSRARPSWPT